jgi:hypothetical protein
MTMGDRIKPTREQDTGEITGAPTAELNDPGEAGGSSAHDHRRPPTPAAHRGCRPHRRTGKLKLQDHFSPY